jgi:phosphoglycerate kinase
VAEKLAEMLNYKFLETDRALPDYGISHLIFYTGNILEDKNYEQLHTFPAKDVIMLENLRFYPGEEQNDAIFAKKLASFADVYVNDAFGVDHREAASVCAVTKYLPSFCGLLLEREIKALDNVVKNVKHPFVVITGGIKLSEKVGTLENLGKKADKILVGGGVASLLFKAKGFEVGVSKIEEGETKTAWQIEKNFKDKLILPVDFVVANEQMDKNSIRVCTPFEVRKDEMILDLGPKTILAYAKEIKAAKMILWSGPLGYFEKKPFDTATMALGRLIGGRGKGMAYAVAGGGDTVDAIRQAHQFEHFDHVSTGGGAMLEYLAGKKLPGIEALK